MNPLKYDLHRLSEESKVELLPKDFAKFLYLDSKGWIVEQDHNYLYVAFLINNYEVHTTLKYHGPDIDDRAHKQYAIEFCLLRSGEKFADRQIIFRSYYFRSCDEFIFFPLCAESIFRLLELEYSLSFRNLMNNLPGFGAFTSPVDSEISESKSPQPREICVGDIVRLRSGGPKMVVESKKEGGSMCTCSWYDQSMRFFTFAPTSLEIVGD